MRGDLAQRLAESFETALRLASGIALVAPMDEDAKTGEILFSSRSPAPVCEYSLSEMEPRMFFVQQPERCLRGPVTDWV